MESQNSPKKFLLSGQLLIRGSHLIQALTEAGVMEIYVNRYGQKLKVSSEDPASECLSRLHGFCEPAVAEDQRLDIAVEKPSSGLTLVMRPLG